MATKIDDYAILELRVQGVKDSTTRVRLAFFIMVVACGAVLVTLYNAHFSWNERFLTPHSGMQQPTMATTDGAESHVLELRRQLDAEMVKALVENKNVSVGLLGLRIGSCDLAVFGALAMFLVSMYNFLCTRRAKEDICPLVDPGFHDDLQKMYVWYGIQQSLVLNIEPEIRTQHRHLRVVQHVVNALTWLPTISTASILVGEIVYWFTGAPPVFKNLTRYYQIQFSVSVFVGLMLLIVVFGLNRLTCKYRAQMLQSAEKLERQCHMVVLG